MLNCFLMILLCSGMLICGSDGEYFPLFNILGLIIMAGSGFWLNVRYRNSDVDEI